MQHYGHQNLNDNSTQIADPESSGIPTFKAIMHPLLTFFMNGRAANRLPAIETAKYQAQFGINQVSYPDSALDIEDENELQEEKDVMHSKALGMVHHLKHTSHSKN